MWTSDLLEFLHVEGVEGFEKDPYRLSRSEKITLLMMLSKGITRANLWVSSEPWKIVLLSVNNIPGGYLFFHIL